MTRSSKMYARLTLLEADLREWVELDLERNEGKLVWRLIHARVGRNSNGDQYRTRELDALTRLLDEVIRLRTKCGMDTTAGLAGILDAPDVQPPYSWETPEADGRYRNPSADGEKTIERVRRALER